MTGIDIKETHSCVKCPVEDTVDVGVPIAISNDYTHLGLPYRIVKLVE
jgi:hypothetical protein